MTDRESPATPPTARLRAQQPAMPTAGTIPIPDIRCPFFDHFISAKLECRWCWLHLNLYQAAS
jgi:hypothetical protein